LIAGIRVVCGMNEEQAKLFAFERPMYLQEWKKVPAKRNLGFFSQT
jgi:hypothetical protein